MKYDIMRPLIGMLIASTLLCGGSVCWAIEDVEKPYAFSGYYKNIFSQSETLSTDKGYVADLSRLRLQGDFNFTDRVSGKIIYDNELTLNDFQNDPDFDLVRGKNAKQRVYIDNIKSFIDKKPLYWINCVYRAFIKYTSNALHVIAGKQAIDWSRMRMYHPFDLFNAISPLDIEKDEKVGVNAVNADFFFSDFLTVNAIYLPYEYGEKAGAGLRVMKKIDDYDLSVMAASYQKEVTGGIGFDGNLGEAGFRGEFTLTRGVNDKDFFRASVGLDHTFNPKLYGVIEYFYNGGAARDPAKFLGSYEYGRRAMSLREHILGAGLEYDISGIMKCANYAFLDIQKGSVMYNPELRYNARSNIDIVFGAQMFWGVGDSEFGIYKNLYYGEVKWYF